MLCPYVTRTFQAILKSARKEYGEAFKMLLASIGSRPSEILAYNHLMSVYAGAGKHSNVLAVFEEAVGKSTPTADTYDMHASSLHELKRTDDAIKSWSEAVRLNPALGRAHMNLGACYHLVVSVIASSKFYLESLVLLCFILKESLQFTSM